MSRRPIAVALVAVCLVAAGCTSSPPTAGKATSTASLNPNLGTGTQAVTTAPQTAAEAIVDTVPTPKLKWHACPAELLATATVANAKKTLDCAEMSVPLDYNVWAATQIKVAVIRHKATGDRVGSLVFNPGGPGVSSFDYVAAAGNVFSRTLISRFDIIGIDPRGIGHSSPVIDCVDNLDAFIASDPAPQTAAEKVAVIAANKDFANACAKRSGIDLLGHVSTVEAARDLELLRRALDEKQLTYFGFSYGTLLGAFYADQFPTRIRAMVLDGAQDPALEGPGAAEAQAQGFERAFDNWAADCKANASCTFNNHGDPAGEFDALMASIRTHPLPIAGNPNRKLTLGNAINGSAQAMYVKDFWPQLSDALVAAQQGDGTGLMTLSDSLVERNPDGTYTNAIEALNAVDCLDEPGPSDFAAFDDLEKRFKVKYPHLGYTLAYGGLICAVWPVAATGVPHVVTAEGSTTIVVVATTGDPATPYESGVALAKGLKQGVLITNNGEGHTAYAGGTNTCVASQVDKYLVTLATPTKLTCG